ncbi:hypothetical protein WICPIJ_002320 [Wickerhamomyces pijperi]|uniref:Uncharacterized protein n=1 Tax=Wickerhamomyces pijperi TaxID=599730 RepID=A0A9P8TQA1_WICPI|nr:hypothetical protein WICPIJ_002320 [Wickerhamomyces pijperi]
MTTINRPIQIEEFQLALRDISDSSLYNTKQQLEKSVKKLYKTNIKLDSLTRGSNGESVLKSQERLNLSDSDDDDDDDDNYNNVEESDYELFHEIIRENQIVIKNQQQRIDSINDELEHRGLPSIEGTPVYDATSSTSEIDKNKNQTIYKVDTNGVDTDNTANGSSNAVYL